MKRTIIYILLFSVLIRLYHIDFPLSGWHDWRQADTASIARNFYEDGFRLFYPEVNWGGLNHYIEGEFQTYPFVVSLLYFLLGYNEVWGRLVSIACSVFTIYGLYLLTRKIINERTALWSAFIFSILPANIYLGRVIMPEPMLIMCIMYGIYFFFNWIENEKNSYLILSCLFTTLAVLIKIPTLYIGLPLLYLAFVKYKWKFIYNWKLWLYVFVVFIFTFLWYYHAHQLYVKGGSMFNIWGFGTDKWGNFQLWIQWTFYNSILFRSISEKYISYAGFIIFIIGLFIKRENKYERLLDLWLISLVVYILIVAQGNFVHAYYQLPCLMPITVYIGKVFDRYLSNTGNNFSLHKLRYSFYSLCLLLIILLSFQKTIELFNEENPNLTYFKIGEQVKKFTNKNELIITVCDGNPIYLHTADRKGWLAMPEQFDTLYLNNRIKEGAKIITGEKGQLKSDKSKQLFSELTAQFKVIENNELYYIVDLTMRN